MRITPARTGLVEMVTEPSGGKPVTRFACRSTPVGPHPTSANRKRPLVRAFGQLAEGVGLTFRLRRYCCTFVQTLPSRRGGRR